MNSPIRPVSIKDAKYLKDPQTNEVHAVQALINGDHCSVPMVLDNMDYAEIKRQVDAGELTIEDAD